MNSFVNDKIELNLTTAWVITVLNHHMWHSEGILPSVIISRPSVSTVLSVCVEYYPRRYQTLAISLVIPEISPGWEQRRAAWLHHRLRRQGSRSLRPHCVWHLAHWQEDNLLWPGFVVDWVSSKYVHRVLHDYVLRTPSLMTSQTRRSSLVTWRL